MRAPSVYLYDFRDGKHHLYLGDYTTSEGLGLAPPNSEVRIRHIYADTVPVLPDHLAGPQSVETTVQFVDAVHSIVDFECSINNGTTLSSHDDCECHFEFPEQGSCEQALRRAVPSELAATLWRELVAHHGKYVTIDEHLVVTRYTTFDEYLTTLK